MIKRETGYTLVELLIAMVIFVLAIAAVSRLYVDMLSQFKQQGKIAETNLEGIIGLETLRRDIEHAGYGLPWNMGGAVYLEAVNDATTVQDETLYNDSPAAVPRGIIVGEGDGLNGSDVLVIKAANVAMNDASQKWTNVRRDKTTGTVLVREWTENREKLANNDRVIVLDSSSSVESNTRSLKVDVASFYTLYNAVGGPDNDNLLNPAFAPPAAPADGSDATYIVYGIAPDTTAALRMPFNRADYYIRRPAAPDMPTQCANSPLVGVLYKATINHGDGALTPLPILDCAADMQVVFGLDMNALSAIEDWTIGTISNGDGSVIADTGGVELAAIADVTATLADPSLLRSRIKEVRIYILAHEGQLDVNYTFNNFSGCPTCITVGESALLGRNFDLSAIANYLNYRWKVYTLIVKPENLRAIP